MTPGAPPPAQEQLRDEGQAFAALDDKQQAAAQRPVCRTRQTVPYQCLHFYCYYLDPRLGLIHVRVAGWFPFECQVWVNGHAALAQALDARGVGYQMDGNCFTRIDDLSRAQRLAEALAERSWAGLLNNYAARVNPMAAVIEAAGFGGYHWVVDQAETSTDILFRGRAAVEAIAPPLFDHATRTFAAEDVLRFLGRKPHPALAAEVGTSTRRREEGWRVKHRLGRNSIKVYDKGSCLRVETTTNDPAQLRRWRSTERVVGRGRRRRILRSRELVPVRKGVANLRVIFQAGKAANERTWRARRRGRPRRSRQPHRRPVPTPLPRDAPPRRVLPALRPRPRDLPGRARRRTHPHRLRQPRPRPTAASAPTGQPGRRETLRGHQPADRQTPRPRARPHDPAPAPLPAHPSRSRADDRDRRRSRPRPPQRLPRRRLTTQPAAH